MKVRNRPDREGPKRSEFERNKKQILISQTICGICGKPVDKSLKYPHPGSPTVDHIIPVDKGGDPSALSNLQLAHMCCNRQKSDKLAVRTEFACQKDPVSNRNLPQTFDWKNL
ncbi:HNH endonuclease [Staphylococcus epidermidis]|uniref:HNH endonuclease n=1 Tax=Staphylococcus epidermidis TaxID=1282 RepID=UPI003DA20DB7